MTRKRIALTVMVDLDPMPLSFHTPESAKEHIENILLSAIKHYNPVVSLKGYTNERPYTDKAFHIGLQDITAGGEFFLDGLAIAGWWCIRSDDPRKRDLYLPEHIFKKCFQFTDVELPDGWVIVEEIN